MRHCVKKILNNDIKATLSNKANRIGHKEFAKGTYKGYKRAAYWYKKAKDLEDEDMGKDMYDVMIEGCKQAMELTK